MKQSIIALLLVMLCGVGSAHWTDEELRSLVQPVDIHLLDDTTWDEYPTYTEGEENITIEEMHDFGYTFGIGDNEITIYWDVISNTTMVLKTPIEIEMPCKPPCYGSASLSFPKGTKITVGEIR